MLKWANATFYSWSFKIQYTYIPVYDFEAVAFFLFERYLASSFDNSIKIMNHFPREKTQNPHNKKSGLKVVVLNSLKSNKMIFLNPFTQ